MTTRSPFASQGRLPAAPVSAPALAYDVQRLTVVHRTTYRYGDAVTQSQHEARLTPRDGETQRTLSHELTITPEPETRKRRFDYFGNRVVHFGVHEPHQLLEVVARSVVDVARVPPPDLDACPAWTEVRDVLATDRRRDALDAYAMTFDSPFVAANEDFRAFAAPCFAPGRSLLRAVRELMTHIHEAFTFDSRATDISTPLSEVLQMRRGVCQDFAHLAIACLRAHGLPARYVSGYLLTHPPPGKPKLVGTDASHAWFSTFVPGMGWVDFDPTNDVLPAEEHVSVAYGRDFGDVTPLHGIIRGGGSHRLSVGVDVNVVDLDEAPGGERRALDDPDGTASTVA